MQQKKTTLASAEAPRTADLNWPAAIAHVQLTSRLSLRCIGGGGRHLFYAQLRTIHFHSAPGSPCADAGSPLDFDPANRSRNFVYHTPVLAYKAGASSDG